MMKPATQDHASCGSGRVELAAAWYRAHRGECPRPIVGYMIKAFGLSGPREAVEALRLATMGGADA